jgi:hypothetical protein
MQLGGIRPRLVRPGLMLPQSWIDREGAWSRSVVVDHGRSRSLTSAWPHRYAPEYNVTSTPIGPLQRLAKAGRLTLSHW